MKKTILTFLVLVFSISVLSCNNGNPYGVKSIVLSRYSFPDVEITDGREITKIMSYIENVEKTEYPKPDEITYMLVYTMSIYYTNGDVKYAQIWDELRFVEWIDPEDSSSYHFYYGNVSDFYIYLRYHYPIMHSQQ